MTTEELKVIRREAAIWAEEYCSAPQVMTERLCAEVERLQNEVNTLKANAKTDIPPLVNVVERLQRAVAEAQAIIEHVGWTSAERADVIRLANTWMKENP